jgi:hypothetical protein
MEVGPSGNRGIGRRRFFLLGFGMLLAASGVLLVSLRSRLGFMLDDWAFIVTRHGDGARALLEPHNEHISVLPVAVYKLFLAVFGMDDAMPLNLLSVAVFLLSAALLFVYLRPLVGEAVAAVACAPLLFLGSASEHLLWAFQIGFSTSIAAGLGALVLLRRNQPGADRWAAVLLSVSILSTSVGIPFAVGAAVEIISRRERLAGRLFVVAVPAAIYLVWWAGWGHAAPSAVSFSNLLGAPEYVFGALRTVAVNLTGSFELGVSRSKAAGFVLATVILAAIAFRVVTGRRVPRSLLVGAAVGISFWGLAALNETPGRDYVASRYQYAGGVFLLMILAGAFDGARFSHGQIAALGVLAAVGLVVNLLALLDARREVFVPIADHDIAGITALELDPGAVPEDLSVGMNPGSRFAIEASDYFDAKADYGSAAWDADEMAAASPAARARIDQVLASISPFVVKRPGRREQTRSCRTVTPTPAGVPVRVTGPAFTVAPRQDILVTAARFGDEGTLPVAPVRGGTRRLIEIPRDRIEVPWRLGLAGQGPVSICTASRSA